MLIIRQLLHLIFEQLRYAGIWNHVCFVTSPRNEWVLWDRHFGLLMYHGEMSLTLDKLDFLNFGGLGNGNNTTICNVQKK